MNQRLPVCARMCGTCPFKPGSPHQSLAVQLSESALNDRSRVCHHTGAWNALYPRDTGKPEALCRGARDLQLQVFHALGVIDEATDEAWDRKCVELGL